jgi:hypothetical protein
MSPTKKIKHPCSHRKWSIPGWILKITAAKSLNILIERNKGEIFVEFGIKGVQHKG